MSTPQSHILYNAFDPLLLRGSAWLDLYLEHFEFCEREVLTLLKEIAERAENVTFSMKDGLLRMSVFIGYFDEVY